MSLRNRIKANLYSIVLNTLTARDTRYWSQKAMRIIDSPKIKVVSLDVFDTCIVRSSIYPSDVYCYMNEHDTKEVTLDVIAARKMAEEQLIKSGDKHPTLSTIWRWIKNEYGLTQSQMLQLEKAETETEKMFAHARRCVYEIYQYAVKKGKRVIAVSDMYLGSTPIKELLEHCGYYNFSKIYVSSEYYASKHEGTLYDVVAKEEQISPKEILHIGDYWPSDGWRARKRGWHSICIPSAYNYFLCSSGKALSFVNEHFSTWKDRFMLSFILDRCEAYGGLSFRKGTLTLEKFAIVCLFPLLYRTSVFLLNNPEINSNYSKLYFLSRDGWLPMQAYQIVQGYYQRGLRAEYLYGSRFTIKKDALDRIKAQRLGQYYQDTLKLKKGRTLIFDVGYQGTVGYISNFFETRCLIDKVYLWEDSINKQRDIQWGTRTFCLFGKQKHKWYVFIERILSPGQIGTVTDIINKNGEYQPICADEHSNDKMQNDLYTIQQMSLITLKQYLQNWIRFNTNRNDHTTLCIDFMDHYLNSFHPWHLKFLHNIVMYDDAGSILIRKRHLDNYILNMKLNEFRSIEKAKSCFYSCFSRIVKNKSI